MNGSGGPVGLARKLGKRHAFETKSAGKLLGFGVRNSRILTCVIQASRYRDGDQRSRQAAECEDETNSSAPPEQEVVNLN